MLSPETVRTHIRNAMAKLGASTRSHAVVIALRRGELDDSEEPQPQPQAPRPEARRLPQAAAKLSSGELAGPLDGALEGLLSLWDVDAGWIFLADDDGLTLTRAAERVSDNAESLPQTLALGEGTIGRRGARAPLADPAGTRRRTAAR